MFPEFGDIVLRKTSVEKSGKCKDAIITKMFSHLITDICRTTGFPIRKFRYRLENFICSNRCGKRYIPVWVNMREWKIMLLPKIIKKLLVDWFKCNLVRKV